MQIEYRARLGRPTRPTHGTPWLCVAAAEGKLAIMITPTSIHEMCFTSVKKGLLYLVGLVSYAHKKKLSSKKMLNSSLFFGLFKKSWIFFPCFPVKLYR